MANSDAKRVDKMGKKCVVRNVHITVGVRASQRYLISKTVDETIDEMFIRLRDESRTQAAKKDCETCRTIAKWAQECDGEISNVISSYNGETKSFVLDICIDFKEHSDSEKFCKDLLTRVNDNGE